MISHIMRSSPKILICVVSHTVFMNVFVDVMIVVMSFARTNNHLKIWKCTKTLGNNLIVRIKKYEFENVFGK